MNETLSASSVRCLAERQERRPVLRACRWPRHFRGFFRKSALSVRRSSWPKNRPFPETVRTTTLGPFGEVIRATGPLAKANPIRFSTKYEDDESDLFYYGYRYAKDGRWLSRDPYDEPGFQTASAWQAYLRPRYDSFDSDADMDVEQSTDSWQNPGNAYQLCFGNVISKWDLWGLVPQGSTFFPVYLDYNKYPKEEQVWTFIGGTHGPEHIGQNSCAARVSAALNRIPNEHITGRADFINSVPPTGIAGRFNSKR